MNSQLFCQQHLKPAKYYARDKENNQIIFFCSDCEFREGNMIPINELEGPKSQNKSTLIELKMKEKEANLSALRQLEKCLIQYKNEQIKKIEQIIESIQQDQVYITQHSEKIKEDILNCGSNNCDELFQLVNSNRITEILENKKQQLLLSLNETISKPVVLDAFSLLSTYPFKEQIQFSNVGNFNNFDLKCLIHNEEVIAIDFEKQNEKFLCQKCIRGTNGQVITTSDGIKLWNDFYQKKAEFCIQYQNQLQETVQIIKQNFQNKFEVLKRKLEEAQIMLTKILISKQQFITKQIEIARTKQLNYTSQSDVEQLHLIFKNSEGIKKLIDDKLFIFDDILKFWKSSTICGLDLKKLFGVSDQIQKLFKGREKDFHEIKNSAFKIKYQLLPHSTIEQYDFCAAIAINSQGNLVIAGCSRAINVFQFSSGILNNIQRLSGHYGTVFCLSFVKNKTNRFISASDDSTIKIWDQLDGNTWSLNQTLKGHGSGIDGLTVNSIGDQIFSGGLDYTVRCWSEKDQQWNNTQTFLDHQQVVYCVNLNESENKLISCGDGGLILVLEEVEKYKWAVFQKIKTLCACRLCFLRDDLFAFQPPQDQMQIYKLNNLQKQFVEIKRMDIKNNPRYPNDNFLFPSKFSKSKQVLICKHKNFINIIRKCENDELRVDQCLDLIAPTQYGTVSDDGQYLITWSSGSYQIQVREYTEITPD